MTVPSRSARISQILAGYLASAMLVFADDPLAQFEREVKPVLEENCVKCHGPEKQKGGLRLDQKTSIMTGGETGEPAVRPGKSAESVLVKLVTSTDPDEVMPPKGDRLKPEQIAAIKRW